MGEKHSSETKKQLKKLEQTVETSVTEAKKMDKLSQQISSRREDEIQMFHKGINGNKNISETAINELSVIRRLIGLRLIMTILIFVAFLLVYHIFLSPFFEGVGWHSVVAEIFLLILSYVIVNHLALRRVRRLLDRKTNRWKNRLSRINNQIHERIKESNSESFLATFRTLVSNFVNLTANFVPIVGKVEETLEHQHLCYRIADSIIACFDKYTIKTGQHENLEKSLKDRLPILRAEEEIKAEYLQRLAKELDYPLLALKLLYYDFSGNTELRRLTWQQIKSDNASIEGLLRFLHENEIVSLAETKHSDAIDLVNSLGDFSIEKLRSGLKNQALILDQIETVFDLGTKEKLLESEGEFKPKTILEMGVDLFVENLSNESVYSILSSVASLAVDRSLEEKKDALVKSLMVVTSSSEIPWLKTISNEVAGRDSGSVDILFVYSILKEERRGEEVTLRDAATISKSYLMEQKKKRTPQRDVFERLLKEGKWVDSIQYLNAITFNHIEKEIGEMAEEKEKLKAIRNVSKNFLSQNTIMQVLESYTLIAYLVMAKTKEGELMPKVDRIRDYAERDIFWFKKYTDSARIGIVPPGMTFRRFCNEFEKNLRVYSGSEKIISNIVIHRFTVSEFSSKQISIGEPYDPPWILLRDLIVENIRPQKLRTYLRYCELINESFWIKPFHEIIRDFLIDSMPDEFESLTRMMESKKLLPHICSEFGKKDLKGLVRHIILSEEQEMIKKKLNEILLTLLSPLDAETIRKISQAFYRRLHSFGIVASTMNI